jgi:ribonuclease Z
MTIFRATLLGTSSAQPTIGRGLSGTALSVLGERFLIDCGEGTQRQLLRFGLGLRLDLVFFTHFHADHYLGIIGLLRTLAMAACEDDAPMQIYGPRPFITDELPRMVMTGADKLGTRPEFHALSDGDVVERRGYSVRAVGVEHRVPTLGYAVEEHTRPGRFNVEQAIALGLPPGPLYAQLQAGRAVVTHDGRTITPDDVVGPSRPGRKLCISGDTRPCAALAQVATGADVLIHEATFSEDEKERAIFTQHSTALEAGWVAHEAGVKQLVLSHFSSRHDMRPEALVREARRSFAGDVLAGYDGLAIDLPRADADSKPDD